MIFVWFDYVQLTIFGHVGMGLPVLNQYKAADKVSCSWTQHSDTAGGEALTSNPWIPNLIIYQLIHYTSHVFKQVHDISALIAYAQKPPINAHADVFQGFS